MFQQLIREKKHETLQHIRKKCSGKANHFVHAGAKKEHKGAEADMNKKEGKLFVHRCLEHTSNRDKIMEKKKDFLHQRRQRKSRQPSVTQSAERKISRV